MDSTKEIYITRNSGAQKGYHLRRSEGSAKYLKARVEDVTAPLESISARGAGVGTQVDWFSRMWHRGSGYENAWDDKRFAESLGVDPREYGKLQLARLPVACTGTMDSDTDRHFEYWSGAWYCGTGNELWKLSGTTWSQVGGGSTAQTITSLAGFKDHLVIGQASGAYYTWDDATLTQQVVARNHLFAERHLLWGSDSIAGQVNHLANCEDPTNPEDDDYDWCTDFDVGDSDSAIQNMLVHNEQLLVGKTDGLYHVRYDHSVTQIWSVGTGIDANTCKYMVEWRNHCVFSGPGDTLFILTPGDQVLNISPSAWGDYDAGTCNGLAASPDYLLAVFGGDLWCGWLETAGGEVVARWYKITDEPSADGIGWFDNKIWYGKATATNYIPFEMKPDPTAVGRTSGWLTTSKSSLGYPGRYKVFYRLEWDLPTCPANTSVQFHYSADGGAWTSITTVSASAGISGVDITPFSAKEIQLKITLTGTAATASPTVKWVKLIGYVVPKTDLIFDFEVLCMDNEEGELGSDLEAHLFAAATDTLPPTLTDPSGTSYYVRLLPGYPQTIRVGSDHPSSVGSQARPQTVCHVRAVEIRET